MFSEEELNTYDIKTHIRKALQQLASIIWQEHRDRNDILRHIFNMFYTTVAILQSKRRYTEDGWQAELVDDMNALGCSCSLEAETTSLHSRFQNIWIAHLPHFDFWITEIKNDGETCSVKYLSFFPPSQYWMNDWEMNAVSAQRLAFIDFHHNTICEMLDNELLRASRSKRMTEILEVTWGASVDQETIRLTDGVHCQSGDFSFTVRYLEKRCLFKIAISESRMKTGLYRRDHYTLDIPYKKLSETLPVYIDALLDGNIDSKACTVIPD